MRSLLALVFVAGCGTNNAPTYVLADAGGLDGHIDNNPTGTCQTACDCQPGLACTNGHCGGGSTTYCCEATTCPAGAACQSSSGSVATCQGGANGSNGGSNGASNGASGGIIGGLGGSGDGGLIGGLIGGLSGFGGNDDAGIIGGLSGSTGGIGGNDDGGSGGICGVIPCSDDNICMLAGCAMCDLTSGTCQ
jgi:hypothetical protein